MIEKHPQISAMQGLSRALAIVLSRVQHEPWWQESTSPYKHQLMHVPIDACRSEDTIIERVMNLCTLEYPHSHFGLSFKDILELDYPTFCELELRVRDLCEKNNSAHTEAAAKLDK